MPMNPRLLRPTPTGFNPKSLANLAIWLDAADSSTLFQNSNGTTPATAANDPIGAWINKAGSPNAVQSVNLNRPQFNPASQNGRGVVSMDGINGFMTLAYDLALPFTVFTVQKLAATGNANTIFGNLQNGSPFDGLLHAIVGGSNSTTMTTTARIGGVGLVTGSLNVGSAWSTWVTAAAGSTIRARGNRTQVADLSGAYSARNSTISLGRARTGDAGNVRACEIAEVLMYSRLLSDAEISRVERYLQQKWNLP